jgi:hypothetical protein
MTVCEGAGMVKGNTDTAIMNSPYFILLIRRDHVLGLGAHLAAGIIALLLLTGAARTSSHDSAASRSVAAPLVCR